MGSNHERPDQLCADFERAHPCVFRTLSNTIMNARDVGESWPDRCYAPHSLCVGVMGAYYDDPVICDEMGRILQAIAAWRMGGKPVLVIAHDLGDQIQHPRIGNQPAAPLLRFPFWSLYVPLVTSFAGVRGLFLAPEQRAPGRDELCVVLDAQEGLLPTTIRISARETVREMVNRTYDNFLCYTRPGPRERHWVNLVMRTNILWRVSALALIICTSTIRSLGHSHLIRPALANGYPRKPRQQPALWMLDQPQSEVAEAQKGIAGGGNALRLAFRR